MAGNSSDKVGASGNSSGYIVEYSGGVHTFEPSPQLMLAMETPFQFLTGRVPEYDFPVLKVDANFGVINGDFNFTAPVNNGVDDIRVDTKFAAATYTLVDESSTIFGGHGFAQNPTGFDIENLQLGGTASFLGLVFGLEGGFDETGFVISISPLFFTYEYRPFAGLVGTSSASTSVTRFKDDKAISTEFHHEALAGSRVKTTTLVPIEEFVPGLLGIRNETSLSTVLNSNSGDGSLLVGNTYLGSNIGVGQELNGLDQLAHESFYYGDRRDAVEEFRRQQEAEERRKRDDKETGWGADESTFGVSGATFDPDGSISAVGGNTGNYGSGGGVNSVSITGAGQPVDNFSQVSVGGIAVQGPTDLEGPEAAGTFQPRIPSNLDDDGFFHSVYPVILDLNDNGIEITELSKSTVFMDASGDGLQNRIAWAGAGDGVLFYDPDGHNAIVEMRQYVFTEWDPTAESDIDALRSVFDSNGDGTFDASDDEWSNFKVLVTNDDGSLEAKTLTELGITAIDLSADASNIELPDGSVITGQTTFTQGGVDKTVAEVTLISEASSHRVEEVVSTDGVGTRTVTKTGFAADGSIAFVITSVTNATGDAITNSYDDNGDGVVDRLQTIDTVVNGSNETVETVTNKIGSDAATAILANQTVTTTSADGSVKTIERDSTGGGWFDQIEVRTTLADDSITIVTTDQSDDGTVIREVTEATSADGLTRTEDIDQDGDGDIDLTIEHVIVVNADNSRSETTTYKNGDGSVRKSKTETVSDDGQTRTILHDLDGDGDTDLEEEKAIVVNADDSTASTVTLKNGDGSVRSTSNQTQSADALTKTNAVDLDGDGTVDRTTHEDTTIHADGSRETVVTATSSDGSVLSNTKETLGADKVSAETWVDLDLDGTFQADELVRDVSVDATTQERTTQTWDRAPDGTVTSHVTRTSSADGLVRTTQIDAENDGDIDSEISDVTVVNGNGSTTRTVETRNGDGTLRERQVIETSADGLTDTTKVDSDGDGFDDSRTVSVQTLNGDGSTTRTISNYAGNGTTLLSAVTILESADRLTIETLRDTDGDGAFDIKSLDETSTAGARTITDSRFEPDGVTVVSETITTVSADGLVRETSSDTDFNGADETVSRSVTTFPASGATIVHSEIKNGDGTLRSQSQRDVSDDGLIVSVESDADGNGTYERESVQTTVLEANGERVTTSEEKDVNGNLLSRVETTQSDDGFVTTTLVDANGDGTFDVFNRTVTTLLSDGGQTVTTEVREGDDATAVLRSRSETTTSGDGRSATTKVDLDGDGNWDRETTQVLNSDGTLTSTTTTLLADGSVAAKSETITSADGLTTTRDEDFDGDGVTDLHVQSLTSLGSDGSRETIEEIEGRDRTSIAATKTIVSGDGQTVTMFSDLDGDTAWQADANDDNRWEYTETRTIDTNTAGVQSSTIERHSKDGDLISSSTTVVDADGQKTTVTRDTNGDGITDHERVTERDSSGVVTTTNKYFDDGLVAETSAIVSADGLTTTRHTDRDGDGSSEITRVEGTTLNDDGTTERQINVTDGQGGSLGSATRTVQLDGLGSTSEIDIDGDGTIDFDVSDQTTLGTDGGSSRTQSVLDGSGTLLSEIASTVSGNGLNTSVSVDLDGNSTADRVTSVARAPEGGSTTTTTYNDNSGSALRISEDAVSSDGRTVTSGWDFDADGDVDFRVTEARTADQDQVTTFEDLDAGTVEASVSATSSSNGTGTDYAFDYDADGTADMVRSTDTSFGDGGESITQFTETLGTKLNYASTSTTDENGTGTVTDVDIDGDGALDRTTTRNMVYNDDGSTKETVRSIYADGSTRATFERDVSSDGRTTSERQDLDGDGKWEKTKSIEIGLDGETVTTTTTFDEKEEEQSKFVTTVSADGLLTVSDRNGREETTVRSSLDGRSYTWDDGLESSASHEFDGVGFETWAFTGIVFDDPNNSDPFVAHNKISDTTSNGLTLETYEIRIDEAGKALVFKEAALVFDTVLDRDMDTIEREWLVRFIEDGMLDGVGLTQFLMESSEFKTRYGSGNSDAAIVSQLYLNSYGRQPDLATLDTQLQKLTDGTSSPTELAWEIARSAEHLAVGNGHLITNNYDVIMNGAAFERTYDASKARQIAQNLIDVVYDRDATPHELEYISNQLLDEEKTQEEIALELIGAPGELFGEGNNALQGLSGSAFVQAVYQNAFGRAATPQEVTSWTGHIFAGRTTEAQFVASIAMSHEHLEAGLVHANHATPSVNVLDGTKIFSTTFFDDDFEDAITGTLTQDEMSGLGGDDILTDASFDGGADRLIGGEGSDTLDGRDGSDEYVWSRGDGDDIINDTGTSALDSDRLILTDVSSSDVQLAMSAASTLLQSPAGTLFIRVIGGADELISIGSQFIGPDSYEGIEEIEFSDGVVWTRDDIKERVGYQGNGGGDTPFSDFLDSIGPLGLGIGFSLAGAWAFGAVFLIGAFIAAVIINLLQTPEAYAHLEYDAATDQFKIDSLTEDDGGNLEIAEMLGDHVVDLLNEFRYLMGSKSHNWDEIDYGYIGHREDKLRNGDGNSYSKNNPDVLLAKMVGILTQFEVNDGDLKILRAIDFENVEAEIAGMTNEEAFDYIFSRFRIAVEYQAYLEDKDNIDELIETSPNSFEAKAWLATIQAAKDLNLDQSYTVVGDEIDNFFVSGNSADHIDGAGGNDTIMGMAGDDTLLGGVGDDMLEGGLGADVLDGGLGVDTATYEHANAGIGADLASGVGTSGEATGDTYISIENIDGSNFADTIIGNDENNLLQGLDGSDEIFARGGNDTLNGDLGEDMLYGQAGNDVLNGGLGHDTLYGDGGEENDGAGDDTLNGDAGDDVLHGGPGVNTLDGGVGNDTASYRYASLAVFASVGGSATALGIDDTLINIENLVGSDFADSLYGDTGDNILEGLKGDDFLEGGEGQDTYVYSEGDGSDTISNYFYPWPHDDSDTLVFTDIAVDEVTFGRNVDDLTLNIGLMDGSEIQILEHFNRLEFWSVETIEFAGDVTLDMADIRAKSLHDQKMSGSGVVNGTSYGETYYHTSGDGSYQINDKKEIVYTNPDKLVFTDLSASDATFSRTEDSDDLVISLSDGDTITIRDHFMKHDLDAIEEVQFSDGTILDMAGIRFKSVEDQKLSGSGVVIGNDHSDVFEHNLGDGSYEIRDLHHFGGNSDLLRFTDLLRSDAVFNRIGDSQDLLIELPNGETVTIYKQFTLHNEYAVENIEFFDETISGVATIQDAVYLGNDTDNTFIGSSDADNLRGMGGDDTIDGGFGADTLNGGAGDDLLIANSGLETFDGGAGVDTLDLTFETSDLSVDLSAGTVSGTADGSEQALNIENVITGVGADTLTGDASANVLSAGGGDDTLNAGIGDDILTGGNGIDTFVFADGDGNDTITDFDGAETMVINGSVIGGGFVPTGGSLSEVGGHAVLSYGSGDSITFAGLSLADYQAFAVSAGPGDATIIGTSASETLSGTSADDIFWASTGNDTINSGSGSDKFRYGFGDGDDLIKDTSYSGGQIDTVVLTDLNIAEVTFDINSGDDLLIVTSNGNAITVQDHFLNSYSGIEQVEFADGTLLDGVQIQAKALADQVASGHVYGADYADDYIHTAGIGSYTIQDLSYGSANDRLTFTDVASTSAVFGQNSGQDLTITLSNGEVITVLDHFKDSYYDLEEIEFSDGVLMQSSDIAAKAQTDQMATGYVYGSGGADTFIHTSGIGDYILDDHAWTFSTDRFVFADVNESDVVFSTGTSDDLIMDITGADTVTIKDHFRGTFYEMEQFEFADGSLLGANDLNIV